VTRRPAVFLVPLLAAALSCGGGVSDSGTPGWNEPLNSSGDEPSGADTTPDLSQPPTQDDKQPPVEENR